MLAPQVPHTTFRRSVPQHRIQGSPVRLVGVVAVLLETIEHQERAFDAQHSVGSLHRRAPRLRVQSVRPRAPSHCAWPRLCRSLLIFSSERRQLAARRGCEVESGKRNDRPKLAEALRLCPIHKATLIIAKLDRLARNVAFISNLKESGVEFTAVDFPQANRPTRVTSARHAARA